MSRPSRVYVAFFIGEAFAADNARATIDALYLSVIAFAGSLEPPDGFWGQITAANPEAHFRHGDMTVVVREHRVTANLPPMMVTVDLTAGS